MARQGWRSTEVLAWTEREGPGRPPGAPPAALWTATAATLGVVFSVILFTDTLCPEHRMWVQTLASAALIGVVCSIVGLLRGWAGAPLLTMGSAALGGAIGLIDAVHAPLRGGFIAAAFVVALVLSTWLTVRQLPLLRWDRALRQAMSPAPAGPGVPTGPPAVEPETAVEAPAGPEVRARQ